MRSKGLFHCPNCGYQTEEKDEYGAKCKARHGRLEGREGCPAEILAER